MARAFWILGALALAGCYGEGLAEGRALPDCPGTVFAQQARIFDAVTICATPGVPGGKLSHAAQVTAEWLDNDGDGRADEPRLIAALQASRPMLIITPSAPGAALFDALGDALETRVGQDLAADETAPGGGRRDAAPEEIHHLILNAGWKQVWPRQFRDAPGSALYAQWQQAEAAGYYAYDDPTCDAACKVTEFFYLASAAYLGARADLASDEMRLKTRADLRAALPGVVALIESPDYAYPRDHWPQGRYAHPAAIVTTPAPQ